MSINLILLTLAPALSICLFFYWQDKFEKEPKRLLLISFFLGMLSTIPAVVFSIFGELLGFNPESKITWWSLISCIFGIGLVEEYCKYFFVRFHSFKKEAFN